MTTVDELAIEVINAKEQLKNINNTINRDRAVAKELEEDIKEKKWVQKELYDKLDSIASEIDNAEANKKAAEKEYWAVRDNLKEEIKKLSESKKKDEEKYHISISELSNEVNVLKARKSELNNEIADLESEWRKARVLKEETIARCELEIKEVKEKLDWFKLEFDNQNTKYNAKEREIEEMEERLAEKDKLEKEIKKAQKKLEDEYANIENANQEKVNILTQLTDAKNELKEMERQREALAKELEWYVKEKLDIKERKDALDAKEKYLRKRYEEAWIKF